MEREVQVDFDFKRKIEEGKKVLPKMSEQMKKMIKYSAFLVIGAVSLGIGVGIGSNMLKGYSERYNAQANIDLIASQKAEVIKNEKEKQKNIKQQQQDVEKEKVVAIKDKEQYDIVVKNKENIINNYQNQLGIYDKVYANAVEGVKEGLISLEDLTQVRSLYQEYKSDIHKWINYIESNTTSYEVYKVLDQDIKNKFYEELLNYQSGSLKRSSELESMLIEKFHKQESDDKKQASIRNNARNHMIWDLADVIKSDNAATTTKKLKR